jgi:hypothetical protein
MTWVTGNKWCLVRGRYSITVGGIGGGLVSYLLHRGPKIIDSRPAIREDDAAARRQAVAELKSIAEQSGDIEDEG